ncbi:MAG: ATP-binding protein [Thermoprotei archaeon]
MLFDERPKKSRRELFEREVELQQLANNIDRPLILLTGIRRIGKTSLLNVFLSEIGIPHILIDARSLKRNYGVGDLYRLLAKGLTSNLDSIRDVLSKIRRVKIFGNEVELSWRGKEYIGLSELFDELNRKRIIIAIDEAQLLRGPNSAEIKRAIAHSYDYNRNLTFILTGSEVGLLYDFLGVDDVNSPLFGRSYFELRLERFDRNTSLRFLERGFEESGVRVDPLTLDEAVDEFDGIVGWLAFFGNKYLLGTRETASIKALAVSIARKELRNLCSGRSSRLLTALKCISQDKHTWSELKRCIEDREGNTISTSVLDNIVRTLENLSIIKDYQFIDPIYRKAAESV